MINFLSNAILVKIRARYAKRISENDYKVLLSCENVSSVASYLKNKQLYCDSVSKMMKEEIHRGKLEEALMQSFFEDLSCLANYDSKFSKKIFRYILIRSEIKQISRFLIFLKAKNSENFESFLPQFLQSKSKIDFSQFKKIDNYQDLVLFLKGSRYFKILNSCSDDGDFDINIVETSLCNYIFDFMISSLSKLNSKVVYSVEKFFYKYLDIHNIIRILRIKKILNASDDYISKIIFQFGSYRFNKYDLCNQKLENSFGKDISKIGDLENYVKILRFNWAKHNIRYSSAPEIIGISYVLLKEIEIMNVINIIEGIRYNLQRDKIAEMLIK